jgi:hypothetical protein
MMSTGTLRRFLLPALLTALCALGLSVGRGQGFSEPPRVVYGKVFNLGEGGRHQLFRGTLRLKLASRKDPTHVLEFEIPLRPVGNNGEFSYRLEIDQETAPTPERRDTTLEVGALPVSYRIVSITIDGVPASLLDITQAAEFRTSFADRGKEVRIDLKTSVPTPDSDDDGMPDWWEQLYGLNAAAKADALADPDGDGWNNLHEFKAGTDPRTANRAPVLQDTLLVVTAGGTAGIHLPIADADTTPANLKLTLLSAGTGLSWRRGAVAMAVGDSFTQADLLAGTVSVEVAMSFQKDLARFRLEDLTTAGVAAQEVALAVEAFSPNLRWPGAPAVWLDAGRVATAAPVEEWTDGSAARRDGYQPETTFRPVGDGLGRMRFFGGQYFFVDEKELPLEGTYTAFVAFDPGAATTAEQALFSSSQLKISQVPFAGTGGGMDLQVIRNGEAIFGPRLTTGQPAQFILASEPGSASLEFSDRGWFPAGASRRTPGSSFTTIGATRPLAAATAGEFFAGSIREVLFYDRSLGAEERSLVQDYQRSRWERMRLWNYRGSTVPRKLRGDDTVRNSLNGGESDDELVGGSLGDLLKGGPGEDLHTGGPGPDRFFFQPGGDTDTVTDFSEDENDVIDLTGIFAGKGGLLSRYVRVRTVVTRGAGNVPRTDSILELNHDGAGAEVDQSIVLRGLAIGGADLARLAARGNLQLGTRETGLDLTGGDASVTDREIQGGDTHRFAFAIDSTKQARLNSTGLAGGDWELRDANNARVASGNGNVAFAGVLAPGSYLLNVTNPGSTAGTYSLEVDASSDAVPRPDVSIGRSAFAANGRNVYAPSPQVASVFSRRGAPLMLLSLIENDSDLPEAMKVRGSAGNSTFSVKYVFGWSNITSQVIAGTFTTAELVAGDEPVQIAVSMVPNRRLVRRELRDGNRVTTQHLRKSFSGILRASAESSAAFYDRTTFKITTTR